MRKLYALALILALCGLLLQTAAPVHAKPAKSPTPTAEKVKPAAATPAKKDKKKPAGIESVTGPVKGAPTGKTFVIARKGGPVTVDASKAKVRQKSGKFAAFSEIKGGLMVTAKGTMSGSTLMASEVTIYPAKKKDDKKTDTKKSDKKKEPKPKPKPKTG